MPFYKKQDGQLVSGEFIDGPGYMLSEVGKDEHTYPVDGWYWFESLDAAIAGLANAPETLSPSEVAKAARAAAVEAITVTTQSGKVFDGNEDAQRRMTSAITAMDDGDELPWVLHDNTVAMVTRTELREALRLAGSEMATIWIAPYTQS